MIELYPGKYFESDLAFIQSHPMYEDGDADLINAFLELLEDSEDAKWSLTKWKSDFQNPHFNVAAIVKLQELGFNLYRLRPLSRRLKKYRILYAYNGQLDEVYLLAVVVKKTNPATGILPDGEYYDYEIEHRITRRVLGEYDSLGLPKIH